MSVGVSLLEDVAATIAISTANDGLPEASAAYGNAYTIAVNKISPSASINTADHSSGQDFDEWHRVTKRAGSCEIEFMYGPQGGTNTNLVASLSVGQRAKLVITAGLGTFVGGGIVRGLITDVAIDFAGPSTCKITLKPTGGAPLLSAN